MADPTLPTDDLQGLVDRIGLRDEGALETFYRMTSSHVFGLALRIVRDRELAEDVVIEVYAQVWRQSAWYEATKGSIFTWLATLTRTRAIDLGRRRARATSHEACFDAETLDALTDPNVGPLVESQRSEREKTVRAALAALPREQARAITATFVFGMSHSEASRALDQPLGTLKTRVRAGLATLRRALSPLGGELQ